jgi:CBS domain-containing protein
MKIREIMTSEPEVCTPDDTVTEAARIMASCDCGLVPIVESRDTRRPIGCVTDRDIVVRVIAQGKDPRTVSCRDVMSQELVTCGSEDDSDRAPRLMQERQVRRVLVIDEHGALEGVVAIADLAEAIDEQRSGETLQAVSHPTP